MPPRQKSLRHNASVTEKGGKNVSPSNGAGGGIFGALGLSKKKTKTKEVVKIEGGLVPTLGWLWSLGRPVPKAPIKASDGSDDDESDEAEPVRALPSFVVLNLVQAGQGSEFKKTEEKRNCATFDVSEAMTVGEFRGRIRDFFGEWQDFRDTNFAATEADTKSGAKTIKKAKAKGKSKGKEKKEVKLKAPEPRQLVTGRRTWSDTTRLGAVASFVGGLGEVGLPSIGSLPWSGMGTEFARYGPVVIILGTADLEPPQPEIILDASDDKSAAMLLKPSREQGVRTAKDWGDGGGRVHLVREAPKIHSPIPPFATQPIPSLDKQPIFHRLRVVPEASDGEIRRRSLLGLESARVDMQDRSLVPSGDVT